MNGHQFVEAVCDKSSDSSFDSFLSSSSSWSSISDAGSFDGEVEANPPFDIDVPLQFPWNHVAHDDDSETTSSEDDSEEKSDCSIIGLFVSYSNLYQLHNSETPLVTPRFTRVQYTRIDWDGYWHQYRNDPAFETLIRMKRESFLTLVELLRDDLTVDQDMALLRGGHVRPEMCLYMTLRYLAGGTGGDVKSLISISMSTFYYCVRKTQISICTCPFLAIKFPTNVDECNELALGFSLCSDNESIRNCVGVLDGYLLSINTPCAADAENQRSFFSGHYQRMGMNIQAICDSNKIFLYFALTGPGNMNDRVAMHEEIEGQGTLHALIETLPYPFVVIADAAYEATEKCVPLFFGLLRQDPDHDNFNYVGSQCRIRIEMAFGYMTNKWRILHRPLHQRLRNVSLLVNAIARLHNFCLKESLVNSDWGDDQRYDHVVNSPSNIPYFTAVPDIYDGITEFENPIPPENDPDLYETGRGASAIHDAMVSIAIGAGAQRPPANRNARRVMNQLVVAPEVQHMT
jgi:DDE superfamily endonuclease